MHRFLLVLGIILLALLVTSVAWLSAMEAPLPWRGALTREAWGEVAGGGLPALACRRAEDVDTTLADRLPVTGRFTCERRDPDPNHVVRVEVREGWVISIRETWWQPDARGRAFADSLVRMAQASHGADAECRHPAGTPPALVRSSTWRHGARAAFDLSIEADSVEHPRLQGRDGWAIARTRHHWTGTCQGA